MSHTIVSNKARRFATGILCLVMAFLLFQSETVFAGGWKPGWNKGKVKRNPAPVMTTIKESGVPAANAASAETIVPLAVSGVPKLFWFDCGPEGDKGNCSNADLYYVDPAAAAPVKTLFASGVMVGRTYYGDYDDDNNSLITGNVDTSTYAITNAKVAYVIYFKGGKIWKVDTTTLVKTQLSNESTIVEGSNDGNPTPNALCRFELFTNMQTPLNSTIYYEQAGPDGWCWNGNDDTRKAVKLNMAATTAPISLGNKNIIEMLFDGRYLVTNWSNTSPGNKVQVCSSTLTGCTDVTSFPEMTGAWSQELDAKRVILNVAGTLMRYDYSTTPGTLVTLYTPGQDEWVNEADLDRDGFVYFTTARYAPPFTNSIKKVSVNGGTVTTLASFDTTAPLEELDLEISPLYLTYTYPNAANSGGMAYSVLKTGGTPKLLTGAFVTGGPVGDRYYFEDTAGNVKVANIGNGVILATKANSQLIGATIGGTADWFYLFNTSTFRGFIAGINNQLRSYRYADVLTDANSLLLGTIPVNLSNANGMGIGNDMLLQADKRQDWFSYGSDILFMKAGTATSLKRITNTNSEKEVIRGID